MQAQVHAGQGEPVIYKMMKLRSGLSPCFFKERHFGPNVMWIALYMGPQCWLIFLQPMLLASLSDMCVLT